MLLGVLGAALCIIVVRLFEIQIVRGAHYTQQARQSLNLRPQPLPFVRGGILDREGRLLVSDEPSWNLNLDYDVLAASVEDEPFAINRVLKRWADRFGNADDPPALEREFLDDVEGMWLDVETFFSNFGQVVSSSDLRQRSRQTWERIQRVRRAVSNRRGFDTTIAEERVSHAIVEGLTAEQQIAAREWFSMFPWLHIVPSTKRTFCEDAAPFAHLLGRLSRVDAQAVKEDVNADDPFAKYLANERKGVSGIEWLAEQELRGRRGQIHRTQLGGLVDDVIEAEHGKNVALTIDASLQRRLYAILGDTVDRVPESSGGAIVVMQVQSREVLSLVSYPAYDPAKFSILYNELRDDTVRLPLRFRAVANRYAPGSTIKPLACLAGLVGHQISLETREDCTGYLFEDYRDRWRCWEIGGQGVRMAHGAVNMTQALTGSCNIFMYRLGEQVGVNSLCSVFDMVGAGRSSGIGLREESWGINPTPSWLLSHKGTPANRGHARLFAIGQGELSMTPIQVANLMATYASGRYRPATLLPDADPTPVWRLPGSDAEWNAIRRGIYGVVNDPDGTAYKYARLDDSEYVLCGKTGSATAYRWPTAYRISYTDDKGDENTTLIRAGARGPAIARFERQFPLATFDPAKVEVAEKWPVAPLSEGQHFSHAWFGGYLQERSANDMPNWQAEPEIAFAVLVEFGGSGGRVSGPVAREVSKVLADYLRHKRLDGASVTSTEP